MPHAAAARPDAGRLARAICIAVITSSFAVTAYRCWHSSAVPRLSFPLRLVMIGVVIYLLMFLFFEKGGRFISETFLIALGVIAFTYFVIKSPLPWLVWSLVLGILFSVTFSL
jgi:hypothetical protein